MENNSNRSGNNFFSGFILGALVGVAIALLFVTKRGKKILKAISEGGEGKLSDILNRLEDSVGAEDEFLEEDKKDEAIPVKREIAKKVVVEKKPGIGRRFFKGISRHN